MLEGSLRINLDPFDDPDSVQRVSDEKLISLLEAVGIWERLRASGDLDADITKFKLSGGEKQLLGIARAMLHKEKTSSRIILMDEATSKMDAETDRRVQKTMAKAFEHCTVVTIAHRLHAVEKSDVIIEIQSGQIVKSLDRTKRSGNGDSGSGIGEQGGEEEVQQQQQQDEAEDDSDGAEDNGQGGS